jgi:hypothetical protein
MLKERKTILKFNTRIRRSKDLNVNLLENTEMNDHPAVVPTTTVVGISPQHSSTTTSDEEDMN